MGNIQEMKIEHGNRQIDGVFYAPDEVGQYPVVIFSHGYNGHKSDFDSTAKYLLSQGICSFAFTFTGGSTRDESGIPTTAMTLFTEMEDLQTVISFVKGLEQVDDSKIFAFGGSQGGLVTALTVDDMSEQIKGMILLYPALCIVENWNKRFPRLEDIPEEEELWGMKLGRVFFESIHGFDVYKNIGKYRNKVLVMHGDKDPIVDIGFSQRIMNIYSNVQLEVFKGEGHGFTIEATERMSEMLGKFIKDNV